MKRTFIKAIALMLCLVFAGTLLAGCGTKEKVFVIGGTGPLSGPYAFYGESARDGAQLAVDEINEKGGLNGIHFKLEMQDDEATPSKVTDAYETLVKKGMHVSIGSVTSGAALQFGTLSEPDNVFFMTPSASSDNVVNVSNGYRVCFGDTEQGVIAADTLISLGYTTIGVIYDDGDDYSTGLLKALEEAAANAEETITIKKYAFGGNNTTFTAQVTNLKNDNIDVLFLPIYYTEAAYIIKEAGQQNLDVDFLGADGLDGLISYAANDSTLKELIKKVTYISHFNPESDKTNVKEFIENYKEKYGSTPSQFAAGGYDAVYAIYKAMEKAGIDSVKATASEICDALKKEFNDGFEYKGITGDMTWNVKGEPKKDHQLVTPK